MKKLFSKKRETEDAVNESEHADSLENMKKDLMQNEAMRKKAEKELKSLSAVLDALWQELKVAKEDNFRLKEGNNTLRDEVDALSNQCRTLIDDLEDMRRKKEDESDRFIGAIIDCLKNSAVIDSDNVEKPQVLKYFNGQLIRILSDLGVTIIEDSGIPADPFFHRIESTVATDNPQQSGLIAQSFGKGFKRGDVCIVEQPVAVYKLVK